MCFLGYKNVVKWKYEVAEIGNTQIKFKYLKI